MCRGSWKPAIQSGKARGPQSSHERQRHQFCDQTDGVSWHCRAALEQIPARNPLKIGKHGMIDSDIMAQKNPRAELEQQARSGQPHISLMDWRSHPSGGRRKSPSWSNEKPAQDRTQKDSTQKECGKEI